MNFSHPNLQTYFDSNNFIALINICTQKASEMGGGAENVQQQKQRKITLEELAKHRTPNDAWMSMRGKVYDVSSWEDHPGTC